MYVSDKDIDTIAELAAFVDGALESADDVKYWQDLSKRTDKLQNKMVKQNHKQIERRVNKR